MCYCHSSRTVRWDPADFSWIHFRMDPPVCWIPVRFPSDHFIETPVARARPGGSLCGSTSGCCCTRTRRVRQNVCRQQRFSYAQEVPRLPPGEHLLAHEEAEWMKSAYASLAAARLAVTVETGNLLALEEIIDIPLNSLPMLAMGHRDYERRMVDRLNPSM